MIADDLFAGAGGWDLAAAKLGIHARGVENMKEARATREAAGLTTIHDDAWTFQPDGNAAGLFASPPCQTFSAAGKGAGRKALDDVLRGIRDGYASDIDHLRFLGEEVGDERTALVLTPLHFALTGDYEWLAWEQVPAVLPVWEACAADLRERGWNTWAGLLQAEMYGVPQTRKRAFLLASRRGPISPPPPTHSRYYSRTPAKLDAGVLPWVSMAQALGWACTGGCVELRNNNTSNAAVRPGDRPAPTLYFGQRCNYCGWQRRNSGPGAERSPRSVHEPAYTIRGQGSGSHPSGVELRPAWCYERPATTVQGDPRLPEPGHRCMTPECHPGEKPVSMMARSVRITVQEAASLQSFPADYPWQGAQGKQYLQVGNAVPPGLALHALGSAAGVDGREVAA